ncbi:MAG: hypothetical protein QNJ38_17430 [Prochloraceae cyanobacterium]|nr:hypothetical protein [Prochloraceae cyanobacterium]
MPNLLESTQEYWRKLDELEAAYYNGEVSIEEVDRKVEELMADLGRERRIALNAVWSNIVGTIKEYQETAIGLFLVLGATYAWLAIQF